MGYSYPEYLLGANTALHGWVTWGHKKCLPGPQSLGGKSTGWHHGVAGTVDGVVGTGVALLSWLVALEFALGYVGWPENSWEYFGDVHQLISCHA
jgi:hypothetical protein